MRAYLQCQIAVQKKEPESVAIVQGSGTEPGERAMLIVLLLACGAGAACGLAQLKVWAIIPTSAFFLVIVVALGSHLGLPWDRIAIIVFSALMLVQVSYLIVGTVLFWPTDAQPVFDYRRDLLRTVRTAIAQELQAYFQPPDDIPPQLRNKLAQLEGR